MSRTHHFDRLWQDAYDREQPILQEAARLRACGVAMPLVELFRLAGAFASKAAEFHRAVVAADPAMTRARARRVVERYFAEA